MEFTPLYWHWLSLGMALILLEIVMPSFTIFWFGLAALLVGLILVLVPLSFTAQLLIWSIASILFTVLWFKYLQPLIKDKTQAGIAREAILGESGIVTKAPTEAQRGVVRFATPILGDDEWSFLCKQEVTAGDRVFVKELSGNTLVVEKRSGE